MQQFQKARSLSKAAYYGILLLVAVIWGIDPIVNSYLYHYYSAAALSTLSTLFSALLFLILSLKKLKLLNMQYVKIAIPISILNSFACLLQRIGLQYTTPTKYAFLEHLSCIVVPFALILLLKKKPSLLQWAASILCLIGCLILTGVGTETVSFGIGELLCGSAGILFGICIVATAAYTQKLDIGLFMMIHMCIYFLTSLSLSIGLNYTVYGEQPIEKFIFSFDIKHLLAGALFGFVSVGVCWLLKTEATRHVNPSVVAVIGPFAAVVSGIASVCFGIDPISPSLVLSSVMIAGSAILSGISDSRKAKRKTIE